MGPTLLLVDDHVDSLNVIARILRPLNVMVASSVAEAKRVLDQQRIDVLISDIELGDGNGCDLMRYARNKVGMGIAMTGHGHSEEFDEAGFDIHLMKPISLSQIEKLKNQLKDFSCN